MPQNLNYVRARVSLVLLLLLFKNIHTREESVLHKAFFSQSEYCNLYVSLCSQFRQI